MTHPAGVCRKCHRPFPTFEDFLNHPCIKDATSKQKGQR